MNISCEGSALEPPQKSRRSTLLSIAGSVLGEMRRGYKKNRARHKMRRWTGFLENGERAWYGQRVILPDGKTIGLICAIIRGSAAVRWDDPGASFGVRFALFPAKELRPYKIPAAQVLGRSKLGVREMPSAAKTAAARRNGLYHPRPGRFRGRPRLKQPQQF